MANSFALCWALFTPAPGTKNVRRKSRGRQAEQQWPSTLRSEASTRVAFGRAKLINNCTELLNAIVREGCRTDRWGCSAKGCGALRSLRCGAKRKQPHVHATWMQRQQRKTNNRERLRARDPDLLPST